MVPVAVSEDGTGEGRQDLRRRPTEAMPASWKSAAAAVACSRPRTPCRGSTTLENEMEKEEEEEGREGEEDQEGKKQEGSRNSSRSRRGGPPLRWWGSRLPQISSLPRRGG